MKSLCGLSVKLCGLDSNCIVETNGDCNHSSFQWGVDTVRVGTFDQIVVACFK